MTTTRKIIPQALAVLCVAAIAGSTALAVEKRKPVKRYRVIFNCDGHAVCKDAKGDLKQWIKNLFGPLEKSHVDALFWCDGAGGNTANYKSKVLELNGKRIGKVLPWIKKLLDEGHDPPKIVVREAKKRGIDVFYSFRFNDIHDSFMPEEMATFKVKHLDKRGRQRGRPIRLAVRVSESLEACRLDGIEITRWIDQGLVDYIVLGGGVIDIQVEQFKKIAAPKGVLATALTSFAASRRKCGSRAKANSTVGSTPRLSPGAAGSTSPTPSIRKTSASPVCGSRISAEISCLTIRFPG